MLIDARALPNRSVLDTDVCIMGAGPAGITIARELIGAPFRVCLVESGGLELDARTQELAALPPGAGEVAAPDDSRRRQFGGTANTWNVLATRAGRGVRYLPLDAIDFETRPWVPSSGWPLTRADLDSFYERAHAVCGIGPYTYRVSDWEYGSARRLPLPRERVRTSIEQYGTADVFTTGYLEELRRAANVTLVLHANAGMLAERPTSDAIERVRLDCLDGNRHDITAAVFVLATGAIENARLLLLSNQRRPAGIGNHHDLVGRFFMDHHNVPSGMVAPTSRRLFETAALYDLRRVEGTMIMAKLTLTEQLMRDERLLNGAARIDPRPSPQVIAAGRSWRHLAAAVRGRRIPRNALVHLLRVARRASQVAFFEGSAARLRAQRGRYGWSGLAMKPRRFAALAVELQVELSPHPENRVVLGGTRDRFGRPLPAVHWKWRDLDLASLRRTQRLLADEIASAGLGAMAIPSADDPPSGGEPSGIHHHMGTTRMHVDPRSGVVDPNCRVYGAANLFVAGSSVFPTGGYANPTLTIVALALRLADHIKAVMRA